MATAVGLRMMGVPVAEPRNVWSCPIHLACAFAWISAKLLVGSIQRCHQKINRSAY